MKKTNVLAYLAQECNSAGLLYNSNSVIFFRAIEVPGLGVTFGYPLHFHCHLDCVTNYAFRALGVAFRVCEEFQNAGIFSLLYASMSRARLEYAASVRYRIYPTDLLRIEPVQNRSFLILRYRTPSSRTKEGVDNVCGSPGVSNKNIFS